MLGAGTPDERVVFTVDRGVKHRVEAVDLKGNKYFSDDLLKERMKVVKSNAYQRSGRYSPALVSADVSAIKALYRANGFDEATVTTNVKDYTTLANGKPAKVGAIAVTYTIVEGPQQRFGTVDLMGVDPSRLQTVKSLMNAQAGQPFSLVTLSGDRDIVLQYYLANGFDQVKVEIKQNKETKDVDKTDVSLTVTEGQQVFVGPGAAVGCGEDEAEGGGGAGAGACGRSAGPDGAIADATEPLQHCTVQRGGGCGAESFGRCSAEECAVAVDGGEAMECDVRVRV